MTSVETVAEFVRGRPDLELEIRRITGDGFKAPEMVLVKELIVEAVNGTITEEERLGLGRLDAAVSWIDVARAFGAGPPP